MSVISRIVRDYLQRRSMVLLLYSGLFFLLTLFAYSFGGDYGFGSFLLLFAILLVCAASGLLYLDYRNGFARVLLHLPVDPGMVAKTHWVLMVGTPTVWAIGLTIAASLATSAAGRVAWFSVPLAVTFSFLAASFVFCLDALLNSGRRFGGDPAPEWMRLVVGVLGAMAFSGGVFVLAVQVGYYVNRSPRDSALSTEFWKVEHMLLLLSLGAAASSLGFARARALLIASKAHRKSSWGAPGPAIRLRPLLERTFSGFAAVTLSCLWMPIALVGALGALFAIDFWISSLLGLSDSFWLMDLSNTVVVVGILTAFLALGFVTMVPRFANFRILKGLPLSTRRLGACVTLLPAILVLVQVALAFPLLYALDPVAATNFLPPLVGAVGIGALICPALLVRPNQDIWTFAPLMVIAVLQSVWLTLVARAPALQVLAPLVLAGGLFASWALSMLVFRHALAATEKQPPLQWVSPRGNN